MGSKRLALLLFCALSAAGCDPSVVTQSAACPGVVCIPIPPVFEVSNIHEGGTLHSGFIVGKGGPGSPTQVHVSFDGATAVTATGTTNWSVPIPLPASGTVWTDGSMHSVAVTTTGNTANSSAVINFRKGVNWDVNGDGYPDFAVGTADYTSQNQTYIFYSSGPGGIASQDLTSTPAATTLTGTGGAFGYSVALGDVDGDGYADLLVGAYGFTEAFLFLSAGPSGIPSITCSSSTCPEATTVFSPQGGIGNFGAFVTLGDLDGDGYEDPIVGGNTGTPGFALYYFAGAVPASATADAVVQNGNSGFGINAIAADLNGDGSAELIASAAGANLVFIYNGGVGGVANAASPSSTLTGVTGGFGGGLAAGDVNGDGFQDLVVGAAGTISAYVFNSAGVGGVGSVTCSSSACPEANATITGPASFGASISVSDVNGDGYNDVAISGTGTAYVVNSSGSSGIPGGDVTSTPGLAAASITGSAAAGFGGIISLRDAGGDGYADLFVTSTALSVNGNEGYVYIYPATDTSGVTTIPGATLYNGTGSSFGFSISH